MKKLNRIERNFIFENFVQDKPVLRLISQNGKITKVPSNQYHLDNNFIELAADVNVKEENYTFLFPHKGRLICTNIVMQKKTVSYFFLFPDELALYESNTENNVNSKLVLQINQRNESGKNTLVNKELKLRILDAFPLFNFERDFLNEQKNNTFLTNVNLMLNYQNAKLKDDFCVSRLYSFLQALFEGNIREFETSGTDLFLGVVFISDICAVFFMPTSIQKLVSLSIKKTLELKVGKRFLCLPLEKNAGVISFNKSAQFEHDMSLAAFSMESIAIEDKRFLHELLYRKKFGCL